MTALILSVAASLLLASVSATRLSYSWQQNRRQIAVINSEESIYAGEIRAIQTYRKKLDDPTMAAGDVAFPAIVNRNDMGAGAATVSYDPLTYVVGDPLPLDITTKYDPEQKVIRRLTSSNLHADYRTGYGAGSVFCGRMSFANMGNVTPACLFELAPVKCTILANGSKSPAVIPYGGKVTLSWTSEHAQAVEVTGGYTQLQEPGLEISGLTSNRSFNIDCSRPPGVAITDWDNDAVGVIVGPPTSPLTAAITCDGKTSINVSAGAKVQLDWHASDRSASCTVNQNGAKIHSGNPGSAPAFVSSASTFGLTCTRGSDTATSSCHVGTSATAPVTANLKVNGLDVVTSPIDYKTSVTVSWTSSGADNCTVSANPSTTLSSSATHGSVNTPPLITRTTYVLSCTRNPTYNSVTKTYTPPGYASDSVCVGVKGPPPIDFETAKNEERITTQYKASHGVSFSTEYFNASGRYFPANPAQAIAAMVAIPGEKIKHPKAWLCSRCPGTKNHNRLWSDADYATIGRYALTTTDATETGDPASLIVTYENPVSNAKGILIDVDHNEKWEIYARDSDGNNYSAAPDWSFHSPAGSGASTGNGRGMSFEVNRVHNDIYSLEITGRKGARYFGFGFDKFSPGDSLCQ